MPAPYLPLHNRHVPHHTLYVSQAVIPHKNRLHNASGLLHQKLPTVRRDFYTHKLSAIPGGFHAPVFHGLIPSQIKHRSLYCGLPSHPSVHKVYLQGNIYPSHPQDLTSRSIPEFLPVPHDRSQFQSSFLTSFRYTFILAIANQLFPRIIGKRAYLFLRRSCFRILHLQ